MEIFGLVFLKNPQWTIHVIGQAAANAAGQRDWGLSHHLTTIYLDMVGAVHGAEWVPLAGSKLRDAKVNSTLLGG